MKTFNAGHKEKRQFESQRMTDAVKLGQQMVDNICPMSRWWRGPGAWQAARGDTGRLGDRSRGVTGSRDAVAASARPSSTFFGRVNNREGRLAGRPRRRQNVAWSRRSGTAHRLPLFPPAGPHKCPTIEARARSAGCVLPRSGCGDETPRRGTKTIDLIAGRRADGEQLATITNIGSGQSRRLCPPEACPPVVKPPGTSSSLCRVNSRHAESP